LPYATGCYFKKNIILGLIFAYLCPNGINLTMRDTDVQDIILNLLINIKKKQSTAWITAAQPRLRKDEHD